MGVGQRCGGGRGGDVRGWRRASFAACEDHEAAFRQPARSAHGSGAPVSDRHRPRGGRNSRASFRRMAPRQRQRRGDACARVLCFAAFVSGFRDRALWRQEFRGLRPRCRSETGAPLPRAMGVGQRCGGGRGVMCVDGGVRVSRPARTTKPRSGNPPEARTAVERRSPTGIARVAGETPGLRVAAWCLAKGNGAATLARAYFALPPSFQVSATGRCGARSFAACGRDAGRRPALRCRTS